MADRRHHAVANDWATKFYLTNATGHKYQSRRCVYLAIEMMFQALENEELPYFEFKGKPEFWLEFKKYWEDARAYMISTEKSSGLSAGINDKHPNTNKIQANSRIIKDFWDITPRVAESGKLNRNKKAKELREKEKLKKKYADVLRHKNDIDLSDEGAGFLG